MKERTKKQAVPQENAESLVKVKTSTRQKLKSQAALKGYKSMGDYIDALVENDK